MVDGAQHYRSLGAQHYLIGKRTPNRAATLYPTRDRWSVEDEAAFIDGWNEQRRADELAASTAGVEWD